MVVDQLGVARGLDFGVESRFDPLLKESVVFSLDLYLAIYSLSVGQARFLWGSISEVRRVPFIAESELHLREGRHVEGIVLGSIVDDLLGHASQGGNVFHGAARDGFFSGFVLDDELVIPSPLST